MPARHGLIGSMKLRGAYHVTIGEHSFVAFNMITTLGLGLAASALSSASALSAVVVGVKTDAGALPGDTTAAHPGWSTLTDELPGTLTVAGAALQTPVLSLTVATDGVAGGCYVKVGGTLFSVADFEPVGVVAGDTIRVQYVLSLESA